MKWGWLKTVAKYAVKYAPALIEAIMKAKAEKDAKAPPAPIPPPADIEK
jgi:hypothetical protein